MIFAASLHCCVPAQGHDFFAYERAMVMHRVARRMQACRTDTLADYTD
ncbi:hypothetical protein [Rhizobium sp. BK399]